MKLHYILLLFIGFFWAPQTLEAQSFSQEIGITTGPVFFKSDYGLRKNRETNFGNVGLGVGLVHYINFAYSADCQCYHSVRYFNNHFKVRTELTYTETNLNHFGKEADKNTLGGLQLRSMHGKATTLEIGPSLEWYPFLIRISERARDRKIAPYLNLGINLVLYNPEVATDLPGRIGAINNTFNEFLAPFGEESYIDPSSGTTYALKGGAGARYNITKRSSVLIDLRWTYYGNDFIDGLDHDNPQNKYNDWAFWVNVGYVFYLNM